MEGRFVAYKRVSTDRQERSGHGLAAQEQAIDAFLNGGNWELLGSYTETESGGKNDRPQLQKALAHCRRTGATLLVSRLDRLGRDAAFLLTLQQSATKFVVASMPAACDVTVGVLAVMARNERKLISERTREALAAAKDRGVKLGNPKNLTADHAAKGRRLGSAAHQAKADAFAQEIAPRIRELQEEGLSFRAIARQLTEEKALTPRGKGGTWSHQAVKAVLKRVES